MQLNCYLQRPLPISFHLAVVLVLLISKVCCGQAGIEVEQPKLPELELGGLAVSPTCVEGDQSSKIGLKQSIEEAARLSATALRAIWVRNTDNSVFENYFQPVLAKNIALHLKGTLDTLRNTGFGVRVSCGACPPQRRSPVSVGEGIQGQRRIEICVVAADDAAEHSRHGAIRTCRLMTGDAIFAALIFFASEGTVLPRLKGNLTVQNATPEEVSEMSVTTLCNKAAQRQVRADDGSVVEPEYTFECYVALVPGWQPDSKARPGICGLNDMQFIATIEKVPVGRRPQGLVNILMNRIGAARNRWEAARLNPESVNSDAMAEMISGP